MLRTKRAALFGLVLSATIAALSAMGSGTLDARAIAGLNTLTVSPSHGRTGALFQLTYVISPCQAAAGVTIGFSWGALPPAGQGLGTALTDASCRATLTAAPPVSATTHQPPAPGTYQVFGYVALPIGGATPNTEASASYVVDVTPTPTASSSSHATPTARATATATSNATAAASASTPSEATAAPGSESAASRAARLSSSSHPTVAGIPLVFHATQVGPWTLEWQVLIGLAGILLLLTGLALFAIAALRRRRARPASAVPDDQAA